MLHTQLPEKIRCLRLFLNIKQSDMAERLGISNQAYGKIERGKTRISLAHLQQFGTIFGLEPTQILQLTESELLHIITDKPISQLDAHP